jgi:hypothetical protein
MQANERRNEQPTISNEAWQARSGDSAGVSFITTRQVKLCRAPFAINLSTTSFGKEDNSWNRIEM